MYSLQTLSEQIDELIKATEELKKLVTKAGGMRREDGIMTLGELREALAQMAIPENSIVRWDGGYDECGVGGVSWDKEESLVVIHSTGRIGL